MRAVNLWSIIYMINSQKFLVRHIDYQHTIDLLFYLKQLYMHRQISTLHLASYSSFCNRIKYLRDLPPKYYNIIN